MLRTPPGRGDGSAALGIASPDRGGLEGLLAGRPVFHVRWGLERIEAILDALGRPERAYRSLHLAGTNGKGSAAACAHAILEAAGRRSGLYTSPHLLDPRERIRATSGVPGELLDRCAERVRRPADGCGATYFEAVTALALLTFAELDLEWAVLETGLGGRLDATNVVHPAACAIVTVAVDHERTLGGTLEAIAGEKAGILKPGVPVAIGRLPPTARAVVRARAEEVGAPLRELDRDAGVSDAKPSLEGTRFRYRGSGDRDLRLHTPLIGAHQADNAAVAILTLEAGGVAPGPETLRRGVAATRLEGRFQVERDAGGTWILDIAHNRAAATALRHTLRAVRPPSPHVFVVGILADKAWPEVLDALLDRGEPAVLTVPPSAPSARRWDPFTAATGRARCEPVADFPTALARGRELAGDGTVIVTGSAYTVADALTRLRRATTGTRGEL